MLTYDISTCYADGSGDIYKLTVREVPWTEGDLVRKLRSAADWRLEDLAERSGVSTTSIHDLEIGRTKEAKRETREKLAAAFGLTLRQFEDLVPKDPVRLDVPAPAKRPGEGSVPTTRRRQGAR